ncbi:uncharacterized protein G2W53_004738 [Senna tora]|uniref:Uncharacterized protein n=1 Tax=Senna tora TaxID=362788 RepID=A0A834XC54_9FABA|nr:uncharacterized protein G2W53_004738 [Senna tora]
MAPNSLLGTANLTHWPARATWLPTCPREPHKIFLVRLDGSLDGADYGKLRDSAPPIRNY